MKPTRRNFIQSLGLGVAGITVSGTATAMTSGLNSENTDDQALFIGDNIAVTKTQYGPVRGFILRGIHQYRGIPYGADTSGENRFMPPKPPKPWKENYAALWWGNTAPQIMDNRYGNVTASFVDHWNYDDVSEDCLKLNVWTPAIDSKKRPVLVWLHGGGYTNGNAIEQDGYMGENLARFGDMVFVSINHRLGPLGFSQLSSVGGHAASGNVGSLDMVAALEWVKTNIANFGGDAGNVTIMGQSGGGSKVTTLLNMPSAKGLFHKAVVLSGGSLEGQNMEYAEKLGAEIMKVAGLSSGQIDKLQALSWREYIDVANKATENMRDEAQKMGMSRGGFGPVADGHYLNDKAYFTSKDHFSADIPVIICSTFNEFSPSRTDAELEKITNAEVVEKIKPRFGDKSADIVKAYAENFPDARPVELWSMIISNRSRAIALADAKHSQGKAPVYVAWYGWQPPLFDGRLRAFHCDDICFWFYNTDLMLTQTGGGSRPRALSEKMATSLLSFMRTGNPAKSGLKSWKPYTSVNGETMVLDDEPELMNDPDREARKSLS